MLTPTEDLRIAAITPLPTPAAIIHRHPRNEAATRAVLAGRAAIQSVLHGRDDRLVVIVGPCSIHDPAAAMDYATRLAALRERLADRLEIVMRVYFEKPRTTVGWKGLINDPHLDGSFRVEEGLPIARRLLLDINTMGLPCATEFLDMATPQYIGDLVSWAAIGARTTESQIHRELASGLSCPVGFKNGTDGNVRIAVDAVRAAAQPHHFMAATTDGRIAVAATTGNADCHVILRGGKVPNFDAESVRQAVAQSGGAVMVDASHDNSAKRPENQPAVLADIGAQVAGGQGGILGVMVESNLVGGKQAVVAGTPLVYGQSITDGCIDWATTETTLERLADDVATRRGLRRSVA